MPNKIKFRLICMLLVFLIFMSYLPVLANEQEEIPVLKLVNEFGMFEAEDMLINTEGWKKVSDEKASGGIYLSPVNKPLNEAQFEEMFGSIDAARMYFDVEKEGYYTIWVRANYMWGTDGNYWRTIDDTVSRGSFSNCESYTWNSIITTKFTEGRHYFGLTGRRVNVGIDKVLITSSEYYAPAGFGEEPPPFVLGKEGESFKGLYYGLPSFVPPLEHPRLYIRNNDIPKIKENLTHPDHIQVWEEVQKIAAEDKNCKLNSKATESFDQNIHKYLECCAFMYVIDKEKNKEYGLKAVNGLYDYLTSLAYASDSLAMARSGIILYLSKVYDWCHDLLTDEMKSLIIQKGLVIMTKLESGWPPTKMDAYSSGHASENGIQVDSMCFAIATYEDYPDIWNAVAGRFFNEYVSINNYYYDLDHYHAEGDSYGHGRHGYDSKANIALTKLGLDAMISDNERYLSYNQIYRRRPDGAFLQMGDIWRTTLNGYHTAHASLFSDSVRYKDPYLKYEAYRGSENGIEAEYGASGFSLVDYLVLDDVELPLAPLEDLPLTWYSGTGHNLITARTGWEDGITSNTMVVSLNGGGRARGGHQHFDNGNFEIYYKGPLALDSGVYNGLSFIGDDGKLVTNTKAGSYHDRNYHKQTIAHNCILIYDPKENLDDSYYYEAVLNSGGQFKDIPGDSFENMTSDEMVFAENIAMDYGPDLKKPLYTYMKTDLTKSYGYRADEYTRSFVFFNFFDDVYPGALIVMDKVTSSDAGFKKTWLLHSQQEPLVEDNITTIDRTEFGYNGRLINETLLPKSDDFTITKVGGEGKEYMVGDENVKAVNIVKGDESGKWRIELSPKTAKTTDYFLNVLHVFDADDSIKPLDAEYYELGNYAGVKIKDRVAYLSKNTKTESKKMYISVEGKEEILHYMVDGLKEGKWALKDKDNKKIAECDVTGQGGVAYFKAPPGEYSLEKMRGYKDIPEKDYDLFKNISYGENAITPELMYNGLYHNFETPLIREDDILYVPFEEIIKVMDSESDFKVNDDLITILFEDNIYELKAGNNTVRKTYAFYGQPETINLSESIKNINGKLYIPVTLINELFEKTVSYDKKAQIARITNKFKRPSDYIVNVENPLRIAVASTQDSEAYTGRNAYMALDGDLGTQWGTNVPGGYAVYEFKEASDLAQVKISWNNGNIRFYNYEFYVSNDGVSYKKVLEGNSGETGDYTAYDINEKNVKYFKIVGQGNTLNDWFNINEIMFFKNSEN